MGGAGPIVAVLILVFWLGFGVALAVKSGWTTLAKAFPSPQRVEGRRFRFASAAMGSSVPVRYGNCLFVTVGDAGIRIAVTFPYRLLSPPLFIAWRDVSTVEVTAPTSYFPATTIHLHGRPQFIRFRGDIGHLVLKTWVRVGHPSD